MQADSRRYGVDREAEALMGRAAEGDPPAGGERRWIALFDSIHYVLGAERVFRERGVWCDLVPTPRELSSDCGMAIEFRASDEGAVREILAEAGVTARAVYRPAEGGYEAVSI